MHRPAELEHNMLNQDGTRGIITKKCYSATLVISEFSQIISKTLGYKIL